MKTIRLLSPRSTRWPAEVQDALRDLQAALRQLYGPQAPSLLLYGSYARGEANEASDVDVLLVYPEQVPAGGEIQRLAGKPRPWPAHFHCTVAFATPDERVQYADGDCPGEIIPVERGQNLFRKP
jgi:predicted nucleotidyltransferase